MLTKVETRTRVSASPLKLSEAIRLGSMIRPQVIGEFFADGGSCALGAALEAIGVGYGTYDGDAPLDTVWPETWPDTWAVAACPECCRQSDAANIIAHVNDLHGWTREQIADWVAERFEQ